MAKCKFCGAEVAIGERCTYCGSKAENWYYSDEDFKLDQISKRSSHSNTHNNKCLRNLFFFWKDLHC